MEAQKALKTTINIGSPDQLAKTGTYNWIRVTKVVTTEEVIYSKTDLDTE